MLWNVKTFDNFWSDSYLSETYALDFHCSFFVEKQIKNNREEIKQSKF